MMNDVFIHVAFAQHISYVFLDSETTNCEFYSSLILVYNLYFFNKTTINTIYIKYNEIFINPDVAGKVPSNILEKFTFYKVY